MLALLQWLTVSASVEPATAIAMILKPMHILVHEANVKPIAVGFPASVLTLKFGISIYMRFLMQTPISSQYVYCLMLYCHQTGVVQIRKNK